MVTLFLRSGIAVVDIFAGVAERHFWFQFILLIVRREKYTHNNYNTVEAKKNHLVLNGEL